MKEINRTTCCGVLLAAAMMAFGAQAAHVVWQIGKKDGTGNEFALAPNKYERFVEADFGWDDKYFLVGRSDAKKDFPYVLPGVNDAWAGSGRGPGRHTQQVNILFDIEKKGGERPWTLHVDFSNTHYASPPLVKLIVNGRARKIALPKGDGNDSIKKGDFSKAKPFSVKIDLDDGEIREGANEITITSIEGSWAIFDDVRLEGPEGAAVRLEHKGAYVRSVRGGDYLIPGTHKQPLLVAVEHLDGTPKLRVELDGKTILAERVESGAYVFEAPMEAVGSEKRSTYRVFVDGECVREGTVVRTPQRDAGVAGYVDTRMGTAHSRWMLAPGPWTPFSMVKLSPDNEGTAGKRMWQGGYDPSVESVGSFSHVHEWTMAGLGTMPTTGPLCTKMGEGSEIAGHAGCYRSYIDKSSEVSKIGYYAVRLTDYDIYAERSSLTFLGYEFRKVRERLFGTGKKYLHFGPTAKSVKRVCHEVHEHTHSRNVLLSVDVVIERVNKLLKGWGGFYSFGYPSRAFRKVNHYVLKRMARFLNRKSQRYYRLKFADTYYGEMTHYGLCRLAWADVRRTRN